MTGGIDAATDELISRYLDDDLDTAERRRCEERLATEPELRDALAGLQRGRMAVARLAVEMAPPAALDTLLEPLRRGPSAARPRRSLVVLLSAAACLVIGIAVVREMRPQLPAAVSDGSSPPQVAVGPGAGERYYQMRPLPTAAPDARALGAADRLLDSPPPAVDVPAAAEPLHVYGPLSEQEHAQEVAAHRDAAAAP